MDDDKVVFRMHDYRDGKDKPLSLPGYEFVRRILLHVLPKGLMRIRHYGFLANSFSAAEASLDTTLFAAANPRALPDTTETRDRTRVKNLSLPPVPQ